MIEVTKLVPALRDALDAMRSAANLPNTAPFPADVSATDHGKDGSAMARFSDGIFTIKRDRKQWVVDGGMNGNGASITWSIVVDEQDGKVIALPRPRGKITSGPSADDLMAALELGPRPLATLGPLVPIFPDNEVMNEVFRRMGMPRPEAYADRATIRKMRGDMLLAFATD